MRIALLLATACLLMGCRPTMESPSLSDTKRDIRVKLGTPVVELDDLQNYKDLGVAVYYVSRARDSQISRIRFYGGYLQPVLGVRVGDSIADATCRLTHLTSIRSR